MPDPGESVLALVALDYSREQIADELDLSPQTIRRIVRRLCREHGVATVAELRRRAKEGLDEADAAA